MYVCVYLSYSARESNEDIITLTAITFIGNDFLVLIALVLVFVV